MSRTSCMRSTVYNELHLQLFSTYGLFKAGYTHSKDHVDILNGDGGATAVVKSTASSVISWRTLQSLGSSGLSTPTIE